MERKIVKDILFLRQSSSPAAKSDSGTADDLIDTLRANSENCVGLAANMIGIRKNIIIVQTQLAPIVMFNPKMLSHSAGTYESEEGCLSLEGTRKTLRYESVEIEYYDRDMKRDTGKFSGFTARIIQHEMDHCKGIII